MRKQRTDAMRHRMWRQRSGITLLFVVSMIVLFMLLATTFLVISSQYLRGARSYSKSEIFEAEPRNELDQMMYMLLRDTRDPNNPVRGHSLLADVYGYDQSIVATIRPGSAQMVANSENSIIQVVVEGFPFNNYKNAYMGQLLTITTGGMQGVSCRIVSHAEDPNPPNPPHYFRIYPLLDNFYTDASNLLTALNAGPQVVINGRAFSGTGAGYRTGVNYNPIRFYNPTDTFGSAADLTTKLLSNQALRPNRIGESNDQFLQNYVGRGDVNEDYDAPDYQNCFLAAEVPTLAGGNYNVTVLPSFHRQALISNQGISNRTLFRPDPTANPNFPPLTGLTLNTATTGLDAVDASGNRLFDWDVDNDRDGINDSVWLDPNLPVVTDSSGRTYKRLFAILCRDMDGRFNLNAHGNRWHLDGLFTENVAASALADEASGGVLSTLTPSVDGLKSALPVGVGMGPAEVNMRPLFAAPARNLDLQRLMYGDATINVWGRNGQDFGFGAFSTNPEPGFVFNPGDASTVDLNTTLQFADFPIGLPHFAGSYGSYGDIQGRLAFGVDYNGQPVYSLTTQANAELHDNEYERNLVDYRTTGYSKVVNRGGNIANHQTDAAFSYAEIERILRGNENDATTLPGRIAQLAPNTFNNNVNATSLAASMYARMNVGGHSYDIPTIPTDIVNELRLITGVTGDVPFYERLEEMFPPEFFLGLKFDINRPFGDGLDDNRAASSAGTEIDEDEVIDNHWGPWSPDLVPAQLARINEATINETDAAGQPLDLDNDGVVGPADLDEHMVRYTYAKNLYVLMMTFLETSGFNQFSPQADIEKVIGVGQDFNGDGATNHLDLAIFVAQWAINVVDFKDKDSIMTPFEFDLNLRNGWNVDGNPLFGDVWRDGLNNPINDDSGNPIPESDRYIVYGCERPNILMTETFAFHDRRTEDRDDEDPNGGDAETKADGDADSDQRLKPEGSLFIELFNPNGTSTARTADIYVDNGGNNVSNNNGINLGAVSRTLGVSDNAGTIATRPAPVWRIVMTPTDIDLDVGTTIQRNNRRRDNVERVLYFAWEDNGAAPVEIGEYLRSDLQYDLDARVLAQNGMFLLTENVYKNHIANPASTLTGLSSAVIGTGKFAINGAESYINPIGRRTDVADETTDVGYPNTRSITINPGAGPGAVVIRDLDGAGTAVNYPKFTLGIPFVDLNISEPIGGYELGGRTRIDVTTTDAGGTQYTETGFTDGAAVYVFDEPLDVSGRPAGGDNSLDNFPANNETLRGYRWLHLQRLANPLAGWHPETNPYLTVDTMPVDLSVFDGLSAGDFGAFAAGEGFGTRERGQNQGTNRNLWRVEPAATVQIAQPAAADNHHHSFYLENPNTANIEEESLGHTKLGAADQINHALDALNNPDYALLGIRPTFPSLVWNNRPFVNQYELMLVPYTSSAQLLRRYTANSQPAIPVYGDATQSELTGFGHLINFFQASQPSGVLGPEFSRLFDYVYVPSRYAGTRSYLNNGAATFGSINGPDLYLDVDEALNPGLGDNPAYVDENDPGFSAPFNFIHEQREPGRVNINTVFTPEIWTGLNGGTVGEGGHGVAAWPEFVNSRRNYAAGNVLGPIPGPTFFPSPYRSANGSNLIPDDAAVPLGSSANMGLMRPGATGTTSLLDTPLGVGTVNNDRHANLKYMTRARLGNLATTRSNVFAVWITVGYFEFDESTGQLGEELGSRSGDVKRHRAFYMIDRSIPVGFEPGKNHNVDKTIMLRRYIE